MAALLVCRAGFAADEIHWTITGPTSVTFNWRGSISENTVRYGLSAGSYGATVTAASPTGTCVPYSSAGPFFEAKLEGLLPDTLYHYSISEGPDHTFRSAPQSGTSSFDILVAGDFGNGSIYSRMVGVQQQMAQETDARFVLAVGDLTYADTHGLPHVGLHFNDVMPWSRDVAYMPAWGNHEWDNPPPQVDDLRNYKGRFDLPNPQTAVGTPAISNCGEDWYWFDYGNVRFIAYPEPWTGAWADWNTRVQALMDAAQASSSIRFIVTFGHRPAYSSGHHPGSGTLLTYLDALAASHSKYVLNLNGHSHNYERSFPQDGASANRFGVTHITAGTGGSNLERQAPPACPWLTCAQPSWSAVRYFHLGYLKLTFTASSIAGTFVCGPASLADDVACAEGAVLDSFVLTPSLCRDSDNDGFGAPGDVTCPNGATIDCDDSDPNTYDGAPEVNDGLDNQCSGVSGYGLVDETTGVSGFHSTTSPKTDYVWPPQQGATGYEVARSVLPDFSLGCGTVATSVASFTDPEVPASGQVFYYLVRPVSPFVGSWGARSSGVDRGPNCTHLFFESSVTAKSFKTP